MLRKAGLTALAAAACALCGCGPQAPTPTVNESMTQVMSPEAQTIWDITSRAFNAKGDGLEASKISAADWDQLAAAGRRLRDRAQLLARASRITVAAPGEVIMGADAAHPGVKQTWDAASTQQVQALIDQDRALFALRAQVLADAGDTIVKAAKTRDVAPLYRVSADMDETCDGCHQRFWGTDEPPPFPH